MSRILRAVNHLEDADTSLRAVKNIWSGIQDEEVPIRLAVELGRMMSAVENAGAKTHNALLEINRAVTEGEVTREEETPKERIPKEPVWMWHTDDPRGTLDDSFMLPHLYRSEKNLGEKALCGHPDMPGTPMVHRWNDMGLPAKYCPTCYTMGRDKNWFPSTWEV